MATSVSFASMSDAWRLLVDAPADGAWNMAVDEILLDGVAVGAAPPTLRFYEWMPACLSLQEGLRRLGVPATLAPQSAAGGPVAHGPVCFDRPSAHEILLQGRKLVGSAQMRRAGGILQHGSILIEPRIDKLTACLRLPDGPEGIEDGVVGLAAVGLTEPARIAAAISDAFATRVRVSLVPAPLEPTERAAARALANSKYQSASWTHGLTPAEAGKTTRTR